MPRVLSSPPKCITRCVTLKAFISSLCFVFLLSFSALPLEGQAGVLSGCCRGTSSGCKGPSSLQNLGNLEINAKAFYWRTSSSGDGLVSVQYPTVQEGDLLRNDQIYIQPDWQWGWGIGLVYLFPCERWNLSARYVLWKESLSHQVRQVDDELIFSPFRGAVTFNFFAPNLLEVPLDSAMGWIERRYQHIDGEFGYALLSPCHHFLHVYGGVRYIRFRKRESYRLVGSGTVIVTRFAAQTTVTEGVGFRTGLSGGADLCWGFACSGHVGVNYLWVHHNYLLLGGPTRFNTNASLLQNFYPKFHHCIPALDGHIALTYQQTWFGLSVAGELGIEANYYFEGVAHAVASSTLTMQVPSFNGLGFGGPYVELRIAY